MSNQDFSIPDQDIKDAQEQAYKSAGHNAYFGNGFNAGVQFAIKYLDKKYNSPSGEPTKLSLSIIQSYGFEERSYRSDHDDMSLDITLPNGLVLTTMTICGNKPTESDSLEGLDGWIYIETKEDLDSLIAKSYEEVLDDLEKEHHPDFDRSEF